jgi:ribosome-associated heat shock protein Hsp15
MAVEAPGIESARVDQWLWSVRMTKTRSDAAAACRGGHVEVNGKAAKPATPVKVGDRIEAYLHGRERILEVTRTDLIHRVGAGVAVECFVDHSPPPPEREHDVPVFERDRGPPPDQARQTTAGPPSRPLEVIGSAVARVRVPCR